MFYAMFFVFDTVIINVRSGCVRFVSHEGERWDLFGHLFVVPYFDDDGCFPLVDINYLYCIYVVYV